MTEKQPTRKAGSIRQYTTLGKGKTSERSNVPTPEHSDTQEAEHPSTPTSKPLDTQEQTAPKRERHTIYLPPDLSMWVKVQAVTTKREISEIVTEALERYKSEIENA